MEPLSRGPSRGPSRPPSPSGQRYARNSTIVLIGMAGVGKTTLAFIAARALGWGVVDADDVFESKHGQPAHVFIERNGFDDFRRKEAVILSELLNRHPRGKVIACGGGVVEMPENRELLKAFAVSQGPVIHVLREREIVLQYLYESNRFPTIIGDTAAAQWGRREVWYRECSSHEFVSLTCYPEHPLPPNTNANGIPSPDKTLMLKPVERDFIRLLRFIHAVQTNHVPVGPSSPRSYFLVLTFDDVSEAIPIMDELSLGIDCWEIRVDLLKSYDVTFLAFQIALLRRHSDLPILFTVRTRNQGGSFPDPTDAASTSALRSCVQLALKMCVEYIDLELHWPQDIVVHAVQTKGNTKAVVSWHDWTGRISWTGPEIRAVYERACRVGADIVKMIGMAKTFEDNLSLRTFAQSIDGRQVPLMALNMGPEGRMSRILNHVLSPVCHPLIPRPSAPGQISFAESQQILYLTGLLPARNFYCIGMPIAHSLSPVIHNTAFRVLGLPHNYQLHEVPSTESFPELFSSPTFGGASVTIPYKLDVIPLLRRLSKHARIIGAVNTIIPTPSGLLGENTDWRAIKTCVSQSLSLADAVTSTTTALVLGAGGTARAALYSLYHLGVTRVYLYNRTGENARRLASDFSRIDPQFHVAVLDSIAHPLPIHPMPTIIISTIPAAATPQGKGMVPDLGLHTGLLSPAGGVAVELAYQPRVTPLLTLAAQRAADGWVGVEGVDVLLEQGYEQFRLWTGRRAPKSHVRNAVLKEFEARENAKMGV